MKAADDYNVILRGRKFKKMLDHLYEDMREKYGLRQIEIDIMMYLGQYPGDNASDISRNMYINKGHVSQAMNNLCVDGYLNAHVDENDRRYVSYDITAKGKALIDETTLIKNTINKQLFQGITKEEKILFEKVTTVISDNLDHITISL